MVTNWLGQIEYVRIEITVRDINDNPPEFVAGNSFNISVEIPLDAQLTGFKQIELTRAKDLDETDNGKLTYKLEDCFYIGQGLLIKKPFIPSIGVNPSTNHLNFPLCSQQFIQLDADSSNLVSLRVDMDELSTFLRNSTDFHLQSRFSSEASIVFYLDLSVKDTLDAHKTYARALVELKFKRGQSKLVFKREMTSTHKQNAHTGLIYGFKQPLYRIELFDLNVGVELIRLVNEFVWIDSNSNYNSFKPFDLQFYTINPTTIIQIEPNFGLVYVNQTRVGQKFLFEVEIGCHVLKNVALMNLNKELHPSTKLIIAVKPLKENFDEILKRKIWITDRIKAKLAENSPLGTLLSLETPLVDVIYMETFNLITKINYPIIFTTSNMDLFDVESLSGAIKSKFEPDYETQSSFELNLRVCLSNIELSLECFKQELRIQVDVSNRNDNEPKFLLNNTTLKLISPNEIVRSMSLFKFTALDLDGNELSFRIVEAKFRNFSVLDWFILFNTSGQHGIKLNEIGYEQITKLSHRGQIELVVETTDGLFSNRATFLIQINHIDSLSIRSNPVAPIIINLELNENTDAELCMIPSLQQTLNEYLNIQTDSNVFEFELINYESEFRVDSMGSLWLRSSLDRELQDNYELFIKTKVVWLNHAENIPNQFRVLVKVTDTNDNWPKFIGTEYLDRTLLWTDFVQSSRLRPIFSIKASDADFNDRTTYHLDDSSTKLKIFQVNSYLDLNFLTT